jgi:hypothetical protein
MNILPVDRALSTYGALAVDRSETKGAREPMSKHLMKTYAEGEKDEHRLTVHGLSYLRKLDQEIELRRAILAFATRIASILVGSFFGCSVFLCSPAVAS